MQQIPETGPNKGGTIGVEFVERGRHTDLIKSSTRRQANWRSAPRSQHPTDTRTGEQPQIRRFSERVSGLAGGIDAGIGHLAMREEGHRIEPDQ